jgi:hypothetical protein
MAGGMALNYVLLVLRCTESRSNWSLRVLVVWKRLAEGMAAGGHRVDEVLAMPSLLP